MTKNSFVAEVTFNVDAKFSSLPRKHSRANRGKNHKGVPHLLPQQFLNDLNHMLNTTTKDTPDFIRISISSMKRSYLKITHELLSTKLCGSPPLFTFNKFVNNLDLDFNKPR